MTDKIICMGCSKRLDPRWAERHAFCVKCEPAYLRGIVEGRHGGIVIGEQRATAKILKLLRVDWHREGNPEDYIEQHIENHAGGREDDNG